MPCSPATASTGAFNLLFAIKTHLRGGNAPWSEGPRVAEPAIGKAALFPLQVISVAGFKRSPASGNRIHRRPEPECCSHLFPGVDKSKKSDLRCRRFRQR